MQVRCVSAKLLSGLVAAMSLLAACGPAGLEEPEAQLGVVHQEVFGGDLGKALGWPLITGDTCGKSNDFTPSCAFSNAPNLVYTWTAPSTDVYSFSTEGSLLDTVLDVRTYTASLGCSDDDEILLTKQASVNNVSLTAGQTVLVVVDGYGTVCGGFRLGIRGSCVGGCNSPPPGGCYEAAGTCNSGTCTYKPKAAGSSCSDANACTGGDTCNGAGQCVAGEPIICDMPPDRCSTSLGTCSPLYGCQYRSRCTATQYCYNGSCCSGTYPSRAAGEEQMESSAASHEIVQGEDGNIYACPLQKLPLQ